KQGAGVERRVERYDQFNLLADQSPQQIFRGSHDSVDRDRAWLRRLLARDRQELLRQRRPLLACHADFFNVLAQPAPLQFMGLKCMGLKSVGLKSIGLKSAALQSSAQQVAVQQNAGQQVIEVVRDSSRQPS